MKKVALKYEYIPTLDDIETFVRGCKYDPNEVYCITGEWVVVEGTTYADDIPYNVVEQRSSGLGIFLTYPECKNPSLIFDHSDQVVYILDPNFIDRISKAINEDVKVFRIGYRTAFYGVFDMDSFISSVKEGVNNEADCCWL